MAKSEAKWDAGFDAFRASHPGASFGEYYVAGALAKIRDGRELASLGPSLRPAQDGGRSDFATAGAPTFRQVSRFSKLTPQSRVVDYGCGSLRIGLHFMMFLEPGNYFGLDVTTDFIDIGRQLIDAAVLEEKRPHLAAISETAIADAATFSADLVFSNAVSYHVHPSETAVYFSNLRRLAHKAGAVLLFDAMMAERPVRYHKSGWAWPRTYFGEQLAPLILMATHGENKIADSRAEIAELTGALLEFRAP